MAESDDHDTQDAEEQKVEVKGRLSAALERGRHHLIPWRPNRVTFMLAFDTAVVHDIAALDTTYLSVVSA